MEHPASKDDIKELQTQITRLDAALVRLAKYAPPVAQKRARWYRFGYELSGLLLAAIGAWLIYPPAAWLIIGGWMLADVIWIRRQRKGR